MDSSRSHAKDRQPIGSDATVLRLIAGMSRGGTTWVGNCLNEHPQAAVFGETLFWGRRFATPRQSGRYGPEELPDVLDGLRLGYRNFAANGPGSLKQISLEQCDEVLDAVRAGLPDSPTPLEVFQTYGREIAQREDKSVFIEKTPHHLLWIDRISAAAPSMRMLVLVRDPYDFMLSYKHQGDRKSSEVRQQFQEVYHPLGCAIVWRGYARAATRARVAYPDETLIMSFEEITNKTEPSLDRIQTFFGLRPESVAQRVPASNTSFPAGSRPTLPDVDLWWMNMIAGRWIKRLGYERRRTRIPIGAICASLITIIPWAWRSYRLISRSRHDSTLQYVLNWIRPSIGRKRP